MTDVTVQSFTDIVKYVATSVKDTLKTHLPKQTKKTAYNLGEKILIHELNKLSPVEGNHPTLFLLSASLYLLSSSKLFSFLLLLSSINQSIVVQDKPLFHLEK